MIELKQASKRFGNRWALHDVSWRVLPGEVFGLLGHNGAGKSTAIGLMLGQVWPTSGEILVCGHDVTTHRHDALRKVGAIFESPAFYDYLSGWRNLEILSSYTAATPRARIQEVLEWVGLSGRERSKVKTYSHGMRARLALAQALLPRPELLILDEPGDGLDPEGIHEMRHTIQRLHRELGLTILLSSHLLSEVEQLCTRIVVLRQGQKIFDGALAEAQRRSRWLRLRTGDFAQAVKALKAANLIDDERDGNLVAPKVGIGADEIVRSLVGSGIPVYEIAPQEESLENFYLRLMNDERNAGGTSGKGSAS